MAVYVDPLGDVMADVDFKLTPSCHLFGDSREELLNIGEKLRLKPEHLHVSRNSRILNYTIPKRLRPLAIKHGAKALSRQETRAFIKKVLDSRC